MLTTLATATDNAVAGAYDVVAAGAFHMTNNPFADFFTDAKASGQQEAKHQRLS